MKIGVFGFLIVLSGCCTCPQIHSLKKMDSSDWGTIPFEGQQTLEWYGPQHIDPKVNGGKIIIREFKAEDLK